ncbi:lineage-specific thermal regulator protein [compost metagenome]
MISNRRMNKQSLYKGCLEPIVLQLLGSHDRMYGYEITVKVKELTKGALQITEGALYPLLHRLEGAGVLTAEMEHVGNRMRKYYRLTPQGQQTRTTALSELNDFIATLQLFNKSAIS